MRGGEHARGWRSVGGGGGGRRGEGGGGGGMRGLQGLAGAAVEHLGLLASGSGRPPAAFSPVVGASCLLYLSVAGTYLLCEECPPSTLPHPNARARLSLSLEARTRAFGAAGRASGLTRRYTPPLFRHVPGAPTHTHTRISCGGASGSFRRSSAYWRTACARDRCSGTVWIACGELSAS